MTYRRFDKGVISPGTAASEKSYLAVPRNHAWDGTKRAAVFLPGHNGDALTGLSTLIATPDQALAAVIALGMPLLCIDAGGGQTFGNDTAITRLTEAVAWVASSGFGQADTAIVIGVSMGSILAVNYAARNPGKVRALALLYPAMDLQFTHDGAGASPNEVDNAYGGSLALFNAAKPTHSALDQATAGALNGVTIKGWFSSNDSTVGVNTWANFKAALATGGAAVPDEYNLGAVGHGDDTVLPRDDIAAWLRRVA